MTKFDRIAVFNDTQNWIKKDKKLSESTRKTVDFTIFYKEDDDISIDNIEKNKLPTKIIVSKNSSFDAAREYTTEKVAVLNFASATNPGGGVVKGSSAQEECLCRSSNLYNVINTRECFNNFYNPHRKNGNALHNDDIIYSKNVIIFKRDNYNTLDPSDWKEVDVITCAAPNLRENPANQWNPNESEHIDISDDDLFKLHVKRAKKIFKAAIANKAEVIILGAFGCGAFRNDPEIVAKAYKSVLLEFKNYFKYIEFAVYCNEYDTTNYDVFKKVILSE